MRLYGIWAGLPIYGDTATLQVFRVTKMSPSLLLLCYVSSSREMCFLIGSYAKMSHVVVAILDL